jgi:hypothetical protein
VGRAACPRAPRPAACLPPHAAIGDASPVVRILIYIGIFAPAIQPCEQKLRRQAMAMAMGLSLAFRVLELR